MDYLSCCSAISAKPCRACNLKVDLCSVRDTSIKYIVLRFNTYFVLHFGTVGDFSFYFHCHPLKIFRIMRDIAWTVNMNGCRTQVVAVEG